MLESCLNELRRFFILITVIIATAHAGAWQRDRVFESSDFGDTASEVQHGYSCVGLRDEHQSSGWPVVRSCHDYRGTMMMLL